jgi:hypothetical protein
MKTLYCSSSVVSAIMILLYMKLAGCLGSEYHIK